MKTLRAQLFFRMGVILVIVSALTYVLPDLLVKKEIDKASKYINAKIEKFDSKILKLASFLITYKNVENLAELHGLTDMITNASSWTSKQGVSDWVLASEMIGYNPRITFVQLIDTDGKTIVLTIFDAPLHFPKTAPCDDNLLWVKIPGKEALFVAIPENNGDYLLFDTSALKTFKPIEPLQSNLLLKMLLFAQKELSFAENAPFTSSYRPAEPLSSSESIDNLYHTVLEQELLWVDKNALSRKLAAFQSKTFPIPLAGLMKKKGAKTLALLTSELFTNQPIIKKGVPTSALNHPFLFIRDGIDGTNLDIVNTFDLDNHKKRVCLGLSLSSTAQAIAESLQKTVVLYKQNAFCIGYGSDGVFFDPKKENFPLEPMLQSNHPFTWKGTSYLAYSVPLKEFTFYVLVPEKEATGLTTFFAQLKNTIRFKVSLNLILTAFLSFLIALLLLGRVSKKITRPIVQLVNSFKNLQKGEYTHLYLTQDEKKISEIATLAESFKELIDALRNKEKIRGVLNKVISPEIAEAILKSSINLKGEEKVVTIFFSDIRGFTHLSETMPPTKLIAILNDYMTRMCAIIDQTHGVVDKFVGDEIMALYGAPLPLAQHAKAAISAAVTMVKELKRFNAEEKQKGGTPLECGIGIHTGLVFSGNMGAENRKNYTVVGANVNLAARLCSQAKPEQILISKETLQEPGVKEAFKINELPPVLLKGIDHPVPIFEIVVEE